MNFEKFKLLNAVKVVLDENKITVPTPIQEKMIPAILEKKDVVACSVTGSGKSLAFLLPLINELYSKRYRSKPKHARALILVPTRELGNQILKNFKEYSKNTKLRYFCIMPGHDIGVQKHETSRGLDVIIATPGRFLTLHRKNHIRLDELEFVVLDEADLMLEMGFIADIKEVFDAIPESCQRIMCSATFNPKTVVLADELLQNPVKLGMDDTAVLAKNIEQVVLRTISKFKPSLMVKIIFEQDIRRGIVFVSTQKNADRLGEYLQKNNVKAEVLHGGLSIKSREAKVRNFSSGEIEILIATDVASRGLHIEDVTHIINYSLPRDSETYIHRLGRAARGKARGFAVSFCSNEEVSELNAIEKMLKQKIRQIVVNQEDAKLDISADRKTTGKRTPKKKV